MAKGNPLVDALTTSAMGKPVALVSERSDKRFIGKSDKSYICRWCIKQNPNSG